MRNLTLEIMQYPRHEGGYIGRKVEAVGVYRHLVSLLLELRLETRHIGLGLKSVRALNIIGLVAYAGEVDSARVKAEDVELAFHDGFKPLPGPVYIRGTGST
jgi:hypothetical protein